MISNVINKKMIFLDKACKKREAIIDYILEQATVEGLVTEPTGLKTAIFERENQMSTALGFDIAMPHGKSAVVKEPFVAFFRTKERFKWSEANDEQVQMIVLIAVPESNVENTHLKIISALSRKLIDDDFRKALTVEEDVEKIYEILTTI